MNENATVEKVFGTNRIGKSELELKEGVAKFEDCLKSVTRFIKSQGVSNDDAQDLAQETSVRVFQKLTIDENFKADCGYFITTAKNILHEHWRKKTIETKRFVVTERDGENNPEFELDAEKQLLKFQKEKDRAVSNECFIECFDSISHETKILLWRYSFEDQLLLEPVQNETYPNFFGRIFDSLQEISRKLLPFQTENQPMSNEEKAETRLRVFRRRKELWNCWQNCISRKKFIFSETM